MSLTRREVEHVSLLARLRFSEEELALLTTQLGAIVEFVEQLRGLNTEQVEPMAHAVEMFNVFAEDVVEPALPREEALANAPKHDGECYRVPAVLGE